MLRRSIIACVMVLSSVFAALGAYAQSTTEPVILTVTGNVANPNRGPSDPFDDGLFHNMKVTFDKAFTFTLADLHALPQQTVKVQYKQWPREVEATGPSFADVVKAAGAEGSKIRVQAIDGYAHEFTAEDVARDKMVLALAADGKALGLGGRGPLWLVGPSDSFAGQKGEEGFVYSIIHIDVK